MGEDRLKCSPAQRCATLHALDSILKEGSRSSSLVIAWHGSESVKEVYREHPSYRLHPSAGINGSDFQQVKLIMVFVDRVFGASYC